MSFGAWKGHKAFIFSSSKSFNHIAKDASILHQNRVVTVGWTTSWLQTFQDTPPITMIDLLQAVDFWHEKIQLTYYRWSIFDMKRLWRQFEIIWHPVTFPLSFFKFLCTLSKSTVYKVLQGFIILNSFTKFITRFRGPITDISLPDWTFMW